MTTTTTKAAANGAAPSPERDHGLRVLRDREAKTLIDVACEAVSQTSQVGHEMHTLIYDRKRRACYEQLQQLLEEALTCWETADHYLRMLDEVIVPDESLTEEPIAYQIT